MDYYFIIIVLMEALRFVYFFKSKPKKKSINIAHTELKFSKQIN